MGKNKLARWAELGTFPNVIQHSKGDVEVKDHPVKGNWRKEIFRNENPVVLELACGKGEYSVALSSIFPSKNFIGIDIKGARIWRGAKTASENRSGNVAFLRTRIEFITHFFAEDEVDEIWIIFPDPHPGKKNSNKRLTCPWFLNQYRHLLKDGSLIHLKTDNSELFSYTRNLAIKNSLEILTETSDLYSSGENERSGFYRIFSDNSHGTGSNDVADKVLAIRTHYESMFLDKGLKICYLTFRLDKKKIIEDGWQKKD